MRKRVIDIDKKQSSYPDRNWLDLEKLAVVEVSSENESFPIESALLPGKESGWRSSESGKQVIRLIFDNPQKLEWIRLNFEEAETERTQEYVLRWSGGDQSGQDIIRQQWNFSPEGTTSEIEDHQVNLPAVTVLELSINPDINERNALASIEAMRLA